MIRFMRKYVLLFCVAVILTIATNGLLVGGNVIQQSLIDAVSVWDMDAVYFYIVIFIVYRAITGIIYMLALVCQNIFGDKVQGEMRYQVFAGIIKRNKRDFLSVNSADYISALTNDIRSIQRGYVSMLFMICFSVTATVVSLILMIYYQVIIALFAVIFAVIMITVPILLGNRIAMVEKYRSETMVKWTSIMTDFFRGFEVISAFGMKKNIEKKFKECTAELTGSECRADGLSAISHGFAQFLSSLAQAIILSISCWMVLRGNMSIGALVVYASLNGSFCSNLSTLYQVIPMIKGIQPIIDRINNFVDYDDDNIGGINIPSLRKAVNIEKLTFGYNEEREVLKDVFLKLEHGKKYAMIGESGSGKSTLIRLLTGEYIDYTGEIYYDGVELKDLNRELLCKTVSVIHQEVFLFDDTIQNNICLYEEFTQEEFERAIEHSGVKKFMDLLPEKEKFRVGEGGEKLSGGQRQRIAIARALIRYTDFLILDEGTSALDEQNAIDIERELLEMPELTLLTVTHHLKNEDEYDQILCLQSGKIYNRTIE